MSTSLRQRLDDLASAFATGVLHAIRSASIEDLLAESGGGARPSGVREVAARPAPAPAPAPARGARRRVGRLARRSSADIGQVIDQIVALVKQSPKGLRAEEIRQSLGLQAKEMPRPLKAAVEAGRLGKSGQKRATTYSAKSGGAPKAAARPAPSARKARKSSKASK